eukprot:182874-Pyramimonas_sp.AAC.1
MGDSKKYAIQLQGMECQDQLASQTRAHSTRPESFAVELQALTNGAPTEEQATKVSNQYNMWNTWYAKKASIAIATCRAAAKEKAAAAAAEAAEEEA